MSFVLFVITVLMFIKSKNMITTMLTFFTIMFFLEVRFVELIYGSSFSIYSESFNTLETIEYLLMIFIIIFFVFNYNLVDNFYIKTSFKSYKKIDLVSFILMLGLIIYLYYFNVLILGNNYRLISQNKSPILEYLVPILTVILILSKGRYLVVIPFFVLGVLYVLTGQRINAIMHFFIIYIIYRPYFERYNFKILLVFAFCFFLFIQFVRLGQSFSLDNIMGEGVHVSHFGQVTLSSMYLIKFSETLELSDKLFYLIGIIFGNILPSSILDISMDLKRSLISMYSIPGGGWIPIWFYVLGGYPLVIIISLLISIFSRYLHKKLFILNKSLKAYTFFLLMYIMFLVTVNNWFMYSPYNIFKFPFYSFMILILVYSLIPRRKVN